MKKKMMDLSKIAVFILFICSLLFLQDHKASAAGTVEPVTVATVDYEEDEIVLNNNENTKILFATEVEAGRGNWEVMPADEGDYSRLDISWVSKNMENIIKVKGGDDPTGTQIRIVLPARTTKLDISINYSNINELKKSDSIAPLLNIMSTAGTGAKPITFNDLEWKKGEDGKWKNISLLTVAQLEKYQIKGTEIYFRIKAVNDDTLMDEDGNILSYPDGSKGRRASSVSKVKINKKATAMVVGIDGSKFTADIKYGKEYRATIGTERTKDWIRITDKAVRRVALGEVIKELYADPADIPNGITTPYPAMFLEIRDYATSKAAASKITEINLNEQRVINPALLQEMPAPKDATADNKNIYISYTGDKNVVITIPSASVSYPYEYCIIKPGDSLDLSRTSWSSITKNTAVKVLKSKAVDGGILYIRQKEIKSKAATKTSAAVAYELASTVVSHNIKYPSIPVVEKGNYTFVKNMELDTNLIKFDVKLNISGRDTYERKIRSIKLGTKELAFTQELTPEISAAQPYNKNNEYHITVTLDKASLQSSSNAYSKALTITFDNGTVDKTSVKLTIKNPTEASALTATAGPGSAGMTKVSVLTSLGDGNAYCYLITPESMDKKIFVEDKIANYSEAKPFTPDTDIAVVDKSHLTIIEYNIATGHFVKYKSIPITTGVIG